MTLEEQTSRSREPSLPTRPAQQLWERGRLGGARRAGWLTKLAHSAMFVSRALAQRDLGRRRP
ncbi:MAG: hypothetical protein QOH62_3098 [Solirubrobacteraceae bacterium]|jgi:hypothetical protein|nr:hypothetical protein [Solirubrobacteraceae bacterium]